MGWIEEISGRSLRRSRVASGWGRHTGTTSRHNYLGLRLSYSNRCQSLSCCHNTAERRRRTRTDPLYHPLFQIARWPVKSVKFVLSLLKNAEANAEAKGLETSELLIKTIVIQQAPKTRRRTYRAHGRINAYNGHPVHAEVLLVEPASEVPKATTTAVARLNKRQLAARRVAAARVAKATPAA